MGFLNTVFGHIINFAVLRVPLSVGLRRKKSATTLGAPDFHTYPLISLDLFYYHRQVQHVPWCSLQRGALIFASTALLQGIAVCFVSRQRGRVRGDGL